MKTVLSYIIILHGLASFSQDDHGVINPCQEKHASIMEEEIIQIVPFGNPTIFYQKDTILDSLNTIFILKNISDECTLLLPSIKFPNLSQERSLNKQDFKYDCKTQEFKITNDSLLITNSILKVDWICRL